MTKMDLKALPIYKTDLAGKIHSFQNTKYMYFILAVLLVSLYSVSFLVMDTFQTTFDRGELDKQTREGGSLITTCLLISRPTSVNSILALHNKCCWLSTIKPAYAPITHVDPCALKKYD